MYTSAIIAHATLKLPPIVKVNPAALITETICDPKIFANWRKAQEIERAKV